MQIKIDKTKPIQSQIYTIIKEAIIKLHFIPGQKLSEKELADLLNVSRTPIRKAFIRLEGKGLVEIYPQRGTIVSYINLQDVFDALFVRKALEVAAIEQGIGQVKAEDLLFLRQLLAQQKECQMEGDYKKFYKLDEQFHKSLIEYCGFPNVWNIIQSAKLHLDRVRYLSLLSNMKMSRLVKEHEQILESIEKKDVTEAKSKLNEHITKGTKETIDLFDKNHSGYFNN